MNLEVSLKAFIAWIIAGMGLHVGWGLITLIVDLISSAVRRA